MANPFKNAYLSNKEKIKEMSLTNTQISEMPSTNASFQKCHRTSDFVLEMPSLVELVSISQL